MEEIRKIKVSKYMNFYEICLSVEHLPYVLIYVAKAPFLWSSLRYSSFFVAEYTIVEVVAPTAQFIFATLSLSLSLSLCTHTVRQKIGNIRGSLCVCALLLKNVTLCLLLGGAFC